MSMSKDGVLDELARLRRRVADLEVSEFPRAGGYQSDAYWSKILGQDVVSFRKFVKHNCIPFARWGKAMYLRKEDIESYLDSTRGQPYGKKASSKSPRQRRRDRVPEK